MSNASPSTPVGSYVELAMSPFPAKESAISTTGANATDIARPSENETGVLLFVPKVTEVVLTVQCGSQLVVIRHIDRSP